MSLGKKIGGFAGFVGLISMVAAVIGLWPAFGSYLLALHPRPDKQTATPAFPSSPASPTAVRTAAAPTTASTLTPAPTPTVGRIIEDTPTPPPNPIPVGPSRLAVEPLAVATGIHARLYFGRHSAVLDALAGQVDLTADQGETPANECVSTVVFSDVPGSDAVVYAAGLGHGWGAAEAVPDSSIYGRDRTVHQQLIIPPSDTREGQRWVGHAVLQQDNVTLAESASYTLAVLDTGPLATWQVNADRVTCSI